MNFSNPYWTTLEQMQTLQHWIIAHSMLYYSHGTSLVTDSQYDANCTQLVHLIKGYPDLAAQSRYAGAFEDFNGSTGMHLEAGLTKRQRVRFSRIVEMLRRLSNE